MNKALRSFAGMASGAAVFLLLLLTNPLNLDAGAAAALAAGALMICWWVTGAAPMPVVALLPLILFPQMKLSTIEETASAYANPVIFLFLGGFMIGLAIEKWQLHKRIALSIVKLTGTSGNRILLGFLLATGFISMWLSNTATTMMMYPIALSVIIVMEENHSGAGNIKNLSVSLMLAIAYASNFGGIATIIGTPPNVAFAAFLEKKYDYTFPFADWMLLCTPVSILLIFSLYLVMVRLLYPNRIRSNAATQELIREELRALGPLSPPEKRVLAVFLLTAGLWMSRNLLNEVQPWLKLDDTIIALFGAVLLFLIPSGMGSSREERTARLMEWPDTRRMEWGVLLLFGGGIALAAQLERAGLIQMLGTRIGHYAQGGFLLILLVAVVSILVSEVMSNVAQVIVFAPVIAGIAEAVHMNPLQLGTAMALSASCAGMLPMGTPPNAIVFGSGRLKLRSMVVTGFIMNLVAALLISLFCWYLLPLIARPMP